MEGVPADSLDTVPESDCGRQCAPMGHFLQATTAVSVCLGRRLVSMLAAKPTAAPCDTSEWPAGCPSGLIAAGATVDAVLNRTLCQARGQIQEIDSRQVGWHDSAHSRALAACLLTTVQAPLGWHFCLGLLDLGALSEAVCVYCTRVCQAHRLSGRHVPAAFHHTVTWCQSFPCTAALALTGSVGPSYTSNSTTLQPWRSPISIVCVPAVLVSWLPCR